MYGNSAVRKKKISAIGEGKMIYQNNVFAFVKGTGIDMYLEVS